MKKDEKPIIYTEYEKAKEHDENVREMARKKAIEDMEEDDFIPSEVDPDMDIILNDEDNV